MHFTYREWWTLIHGMVLGAVFLLAFAGGLAGLWSLRANLVTPEGVVERMRRLKVGVVAMALAAWGTVITGTWIVYPWYREDVPESARSQLLADPDRMDWHKFGMEWKEHIAWISPMLATVVAFIVLYYGTNLIRHDRVRKTAITLFVLAFAFAAVAGALGAFITKVEPVT
jgi:branched-subunit amino acid ABC-type transport system permease component